MEKIAIVVDTGTDATVKLSEGLDIFRIPLNITIDNKIYTEGVDITGEEVFQAMEKTKVTSSLPSGKDILNIFDDIKAKGYTHAIVVTISSGLSGTHNAIRNICDDIEGLEITVIDTLRISVGSGYSAIRAAEMVKAGKSYKEIIEDVEKHKLDANVFFTLKSLDNLIAGGRIGLVAGTVANVLNIKPIISCNEDGVYFTVGKTRGYPRVIYKMIDEAYKFVEGYHNYRVVLLHADSHEDLDAILTYVKNKFDKAKEVLVETISPALSIHSGREGVGIGVSRV